MPLRAPGTRRTKGASARGGASSPYPRGSPPPRPGRPRAGRHGLRRRERPSRRPRRRRPPPPSRAATRRFAAGHGKPWRCCCCPPNCRECAPDPVVEFTPNHEATCSRSVLPVLGGGVVVLGRVPTGPGVVFLSALGEPGHFPAADVIRRPLGDPCGRALRRLLLERGEMRLARHAPPYEWHSPRRPVTGLAGHLALRAAAHPREGPRGRAHSWAAQGGYAPRGGTRASTFRENTNGSSGVCMGCCLDEDARLAAALAQSLPSRQGGGDHRGGRRRHTMALEPLVPPDSVRVATRIAARTILASQQCTRMPQNGAKRPFLPICVHSCVPTSARNGATVYTNGPKQLQEAILANLCTLLCPWQTDPAGARA